MSKQYHFVVNYDTDTKRWSIDPETLEAQFHNGEVWDKTAEEWEGFRNTDEMEEDFTSREDVLSEILRDYNQLLDEEN